MRLWTTVILSLCCQAQTQDFYEAEEHSNVTLTWIFPVNTDRNAPLLTVDIVYVNTMRFIYCYRSRFNYEWYQEDRYRGRLHCDLQQVFTRRINCVLTKLSLSDAGTYRCIIFSNEKTESKLCDLNVTAARKPPDEPPRPASRGRTAFYVALVLFIAVTAALCVCCLKTCSTSSIRTTSWFSK